MTLSYNLMLRSVGFAVRQLQIFALAAAGVMATPVMQAAHAGCEDSPGRAVDWQECRKTSVMLNGIDLADGNFEKANLSSSDIRNARLIGSNFSKANLVRASLAGANASNADFSGAIASRTDFSEGIFKDTNFFKAEIIIK
ncbi:MAG: pentapeptide repeat-containing protein [Pseudomonadota bacterium]